MKRIVIFLIALVLLLSSSSVVFAAKPGGQKEALNDALTLGADLHLSRQGTYDGIANTWEWVIGSDSSGPNVQGISATGLLAAYERTDDSSYLDGAIAAGDTLVARYDAAPEKRAYSQDIEFLVRLSQDSGDTSYATVAQQWYANTTDAYDAEELVDYYIDALGVIAAWDLGSQIRAAVAVGETGYATDIASSLFNHNDFDLNDEGLGGWDYGSLLWALRDLGDNSFRSHVEEMRDILLDTQQEGHSWDSDYQSTAYAVLGLARPRTPVLAQAVSDAWVFLDNEQTEEGGWGTPGIGEVNSEVLMALAIIRLDEGKKSGHLDPQPEKGNDEGKHPRDPAL